MIFLPNMREPEIFLSACARLSARLIACMPALISDEKNLALYGKCNNPRGHGHTLPGGGDDRRQITTNGAGRFLDFRFPRRHRGRARAVADKHLDLETEEFRDAAFDRRKHRPGALAEVRCASWAIGSCVCGCGKRLTIVSPCATRAAAGKRAALRPAPPH